MDMGPENSTGEMQFEGSEAVALARPVRPTRPKTARPAARPMQLTNPIEPTTNANGDEVRACPSENERPAQSASNAPLERPSRPKSARRARVLEPDQIAASKGEEYEPPASSARDEMLGVSEAQETSKVGGIVEAFGQIATRLKKSKREEKEQTVVVSDESTIEAEASVGVLQNLQKLVARSKKSEVAEDFAPMLEQDVEAEVEAPIAAPKRKSSILARFDTPVMGVVAGIAVSSFGLIAASALLG